MPVRLRLRRRGKWRRHLRGVLDGQLPVARGRRRRMKLRIGLLALAASGWLAAAAVWWLFIDESYRLGYRDGLADGDDREAQRAGA